MPIILGSMLAATPREERSSLLQLHEEDVVLLFTGGGAPPKVVLLTKSTSSATIDMAVNLLAMMSSSMARKDIMNKTALVSLPFFLVLQTHLLTCRPVCVVLVIQ